MWYLWVAAAVALVTLVLSVSFRFSNLVLHPARATREEALALEREQGGVTGEEIAALPCEQGEFTAFDGVKLHYLYFRCGAPNARACVLVHGFSSRSERMVRYAKLYLARGYDALVFDHRNSGDSGGTATTMGFRERRDLMDLLDFVRADKSAYGEDAVVGAHGVSMGAATALLAACTSNPPDFVVADCPFADLTEQLTYNVRRIRHMPTFPFAPLADLLTRMRAGFRYRDVSPLREIEQRDGLPEVPVLFIHGEGDTFIPAEASKALFAAKRGKKQLVLIPGAGHARSIAKDPERYAAALGAFLDEYGF